ncbi:unnamed protein product [Paramecium sonneborni]|uniref:Uncharacterized protein n=1 Tax=Paramecium sonneborni TaxID=65129 RepID=A0A8S1LT58_9CILI|nr:unnamed protein product [Paramecium sonneborni]
MGVNTQEWIEEYVQNNKKHGKWTATWQGEMIPGFGGLYNDDEKKQVQIMLNQILQQIIGLGIGQYH